MSRTFFTALLCTAAVGLGACTHPDGTPDNRATGAVIGATGGAMIGQAVRGDSKGTLIGAAGGGALGALAGHDQEVQQGVRTW